MSKNQQSNLHLKIKFNRIEDNYYLNNTEDLDFFSLYSKKTQKSQRRAQKIDAVFNTCSNVLTSPKTENRELNATFTNHQFKTITQKTSQKGVSEQDFDLKSDNNKTVADVEIQRQIMFSPLRDLNQKQYNMSFMKEFTEDKKDINKRMFNLFDVNINETIGDEPKFPKTSNISRAVSKKRKNIQMKVRSNYNIDN